MLYTLEDDAWQPYRSEDENAPSSFGYLDANDDFLIVAGPYGATLFDGETWSPIWQPVSKMDQMRLDLLRQQVGNLENLVDIAKDLAEEQKKQEGR